MYKLVIFYLFLSIISAKDSSNTTGGETEVNKLSVAWTGGENFASHYTGETHPSPTQLHGNNNRLGAAWSGGDNSASHHTSKIILSHDRQNIVRNKVIVLTNQNIHFKRMPKNMKESPFLLWWQIFRNKVMVLTNQYIHFKRMPNNMKESSFLWWQSMLFVIKMF